MANTIAEFYTEELDDWNISIDRYNQEMDECEEKLKEVIRRNNIPQIGTKAQHYQDLLTAAVKKFYFLQEDFNEQETRLSKNDNPADNSLLSAETEKQQNELRSRMQAAEREYIDAKYACYNFLSGTLKKK